MTEEAQHSRESWAKCMMGAWMCRWSCLWWDCTRSPHLQRRCLSLSQKVGGHSGHLGDPAFTVPASDVCCWWLSCRFLCRPWSYMLNVHRLHVSLHFSPTYLGWFLSKRRLLSLSSCLSKSPMSKAAPQVTGSLPALKGWSCSHLG